MMKLSEDLNELKDFVKNNPEVLEIILTDGKVLSNVSELMTLAKLNPRAKLKNHDFKKKGCDIKLPNGFKLEQKDTFYGQGTNKKGGRIQHLLGKKNNCDGFYFKEWITGKRFFMFHDEFFDEIKLDISGGQDEMRWIADYDLTPRQGLSTKSKTYHNTLVLLKYEVKTRGQMCKRIRDEWS